MVVSPSWAKWVGRVRAVFAVLTAGFILASCSSGGSETRQWLSDAAGFNVTPEVVDCAEDAMDDLLTEAERREWLAHDPESITVENEKPVFGAVDAPTRSGGRFVYEFGLFPLRKGGAAVDQFVSIEDYFDLTISLTQLVEWREADERHRRNEL